MTKWDVHVVAEGPEDAIVAVAPGLFRETTIAGTEGPHVVGTAGRRLSVTVRDVEYPEQSEAYEHVIADVAAMLGPQWTVHAAEQVPPSS
jgi:hypothetical protein